jgi:hypothetical protein
VLPEESGQQAAPAKAGPVTIPGSHHTGTFSRNLALGLASGALTIAALAVAGGLIIPAGRRRNWRAARK